MKFVFTDKKVTLPNFIHKYAEKKVGKLDRFFKEDATASITFSVEKERLNRVEITIRSSGTIFRVSESTSDMAGVHRRRGNHPGASDSEEQDPAWEKRLRQGAFERAGGCGGGLLLRPRGAGGGRVPHRPEQDLPYQAYEPGRGYFADESAGAQLLRL